MKFRAKLTIAMVLLLSLTYGIGGSLMIAQSFSASIDRERDAAVQTYRMVVDVLDLGSATTPRPARRPTPSRSCCTSSAAAGRARQRASDPAHR